MNNSVKYFVQLSWVLSIFSLAWFSKAGNNSIQSETGNFTYYAPNHYVQPIDSPDVNLPYPLNNNNGLFNFNDPLNLNNNVIYDPESGTYIFNQSLGEGENQIPIGTPFYMTPEEYYQYDIDKALKEYWAKKIENESPSSSALIPDLSVGNQRFRDIFGNDKIEIRPQGSAELSFGINSSRTDNPIIPERQRRITTFDFDQRIQLNVLGSIGDKLKLQMAYNTQATFDFENITKLNYEGYDDDILQGLEVGNVSMPLSGSLITGSQSLFGVKSKLKFGRLTVTSVLSQQKGQTKEIEISGGAQITEFELYADAYEENKHFFINHYFQQNYDRANRTLPVVSAPIQITRIEVWVTNRINDVDDTRNIIAFSDLGETNVFESPALASTVVTINGLPNNTVNALYDYVKAQPGVRSFNAANSVLSNTPYGPMTQAIHFEKLRNARLLSPSEYTFNPQLGFVSLNQSLNNDEILAVSYQYTYNGQTYQVGEFSTDGIAGTDALYMKMLKSTIRDPRSTLWDLMMKNVYSIGAYQIDQNNFRLDVWYNNPNTSIDINYIPRPGVDSRPLVQLIGCDRLNQQMAAIPDGVFDFVPVQPQGMQQGGGMQGGGGIQGGQGGGMGQAMASGTINPINGRIYFTTVEPFGKTLDEELQAAGIDQLTRNAVVFKALYDSTKIAAQQMPELNRYKIKGVYQSRVSSEIYLNALNIPQGSVRVTAGGRQLVEGSDYTVDYNLGRVRILNEGVLSSGQPVKISLESNTLFSIQTKTFIGTHFDYRINKDFNVGATMVRLTERPLTQKINMGDEPIKNTMIGFNGNYRTESGFLTKMVDKIPGINTKEKSTITISGEYARIIPGHNRAIGKEGNAYIDDFEGSQSIIDIRNFNSWVISGVPQNQPQLFPEGGDAFFNDLRSGMNRAKISWYVIDPLFFRDNNLTPGHIKGHPMQQDNRMREVLVREVFPNKQIATGELSNIPVLDVAFYPNERGPYNFDNGSFAAGLDNDGTLLNPNSRWGGIMRPLTTNDFEAANIEFIQFWVMDPFAPTVSNNLGEPSSNVDATNTTGGDLYFNLGNISEDVLRDGVMQFENGLPVDGVFNPQTMTTTVWGHVPTTQVIVNAFDNNPASREFQDVGLDGLKNNQEATFFANYVAWVNSSSLSPAAKQAILADVSADDFHYFRGDDYDAQQLDILQRYKKFNGLEGNSPTSEQSAQQNNDGYPTAATTLPNVEDINNDNTLSESEGYFQYKVSMRPQDMVVGKNFITDRVLGIDQRSGRQVYWYQFKIPIQETYEKIGPISDFRSIRFIRMFMKDFQEPVVLRFARLELLRGEWRKYRESLLADGEYLQPEEGNTTFNIAAVNIEDNGEREPIKYVVPPGIQRELNFQSANLAQLNEQSLVLDVCGLRDGDARAAFRNAVFDVRSYKKLRMFVHGEYKDINNKVLDDEVTVFIRLGTDFKDNYYEYEMPVKITEWYTTDEQLIWPEANNMVIDFEQLRLVKRERNVALSSGIAQINVRYSKPDPDNPTRMITVVGNPNMQNIKTIMIGVRNPKKDDPKNIWQPDDGQDKCIEIWVNELRLTDFEQSGGWAAIGNVNANLADFANVSVSGNISTPFFGSVDKRVSERQRERIMGFDASTTIQLGKFFGDNSGVSLPLFLGYSEILIDPQFDPLNPDILFEDIVSDLTPEERRERIQISRDYARRRSLNFTNVRWDRQTEKEKRVLDPSNFALSYSYSELFRRDINTQYNFGKNYRAGLDYQFAPKSEPWKPFGKSKFLKKSKWFKPIEDFNLYLKPKQIGFRTNLDRTYNEYEIRSNLGAITIPQYTKTFFWDRMYDFKYDITRSLKVDYNANNRSFIDEPSNVKLMNGVYGYEEDSIRNQVRQSLMQFGSNLRFTQQFNVNYTLPFAKFPLTDWISATVRYSATSEWQRAPLALDDIGNTIQNSRMVNMNGQFNMISLYNKVPYLKKINQKYSGVPARQQAAKRTAPTQNKPDNKDPKKEEEKKNGHNPLHIALRTIMGLRNITVNYSINNGILLPGFAPTNYIAGLDNNFSGPGIPFVLGGYQRFDFFGNETGFDYADFALANGWMVGDSSYKITTQYLNTSADNLAMKATIEPIPGLRLDLTAERVRNTNMAENFRWNPDSLRHEHQSPMTMGSFSASTIAWRTAFAKDDKLTYGNPIFDNLRDSRLEVSAILASENPNSLGLDSAGYNVGFGASSQDVVVGAFLSAYTGRNPTAKNINPLSVIPLPNWRLTFDGLSKVKKLQKYIRTLTVNHAYRANYTIGNYTTNLLAQRDADGFLFGTDAVGNFIPERQLLTVTILEQFSPLINFDATLQNSIIAKIELKKDRNISLALSNNQITEIKGNEIVIGSGYRFKEVKFPFKIGDKQPQSDLNLRTDLSIRDNKIITRKIVENQNQITSGQRMISIKVTADYQLGKALSLRFFYDQVVNNPYVSTSFRTSNINSGIAVRFTLTQ
ncbi:MAG: cell surface protein SprA [Flavobacteriales bacterium]